MFFISCSNNVLYDTPGYVLFAQWQRDVKDISISSFKGCFFSLLFAGKQAVKSDNQFRVMCVAMHPSHPEVFMCGGYSSMVKAWDSRSGKVKLINLLIAHLSFLLTLVHWLQFGHINLGQARFLSMTPTHCLIAHIYKHASVHFSLHNDPCYILPDNAAALQGIPLIV